MTTTKRCHGLMSDVESGASEDRRPSVEITLRAGCVRRAMGAANLVCFSVARGQGGEVEGGVVFMTAVLLVERIASACNCDPFSVLEKMADCFKLKRRRLAS
jgi:hypothetical protein